MSDEHNAGAHDERRASESEGLEISPATHSTPGGADRRTFFGRALMSLGLISGYGYFVALALRFLYPSETSSRRWQFLATLSEFPAGTQRVYRSPVGHRVLVTRVSEAADASAFLAFSDVCPHLGCRVHWEPQNDRFFCPCHNGVFDASGKAVSGPPAKAGQALLRYPVRVEEELVMIEVPVEDLRAGTA